MCVLGRESVCISFRVWGCNDKYWYVRRSQWPPDLRRGSATARLLELRVRILTKASTIVVCGCCVLSGRGLCVRLTTRPEESYRVWCVQLAWSRSPVRGGRDPESGRRAIEKKKLAYGGKNVLVLCLKKGMLPTCLLCRNNPSRVQYSLLRFLDRIHLVEIWTCDQLLTETAATQHTTDAHPCPQQDSNPRSSNQAASDRHFRPHEHWNRPLANIPSAVLWRSASSKAYYKEFHFQEWSTLSVALNGV